MEKGENADNQHFLLLPQCFQIHIPLIIDNDSNESNTVQTVTQNQYYLGDIAAVSANIRAFLEFPLPVLRTTFSRSHCFYRQSLARLLACCILDKRFAGSRSSHYLSRKSREIFHNSRPNNSSCSGPIGPMIELIQILFDINILPRFGAD